MDRLHAVELWWGSVCKCALPTDRPTVLAVLEQSENIQSAGWFNSCRHSRDFKLKVPYYAHFQVPTFYLECWKCFTYFNVHKTVYFAVIGPFLQTFIHPLSECSVLVPPPPLDKAQSALIGQVSQAWAGTAVYHSASAPLVFLRPWTCWWCGWGQWWYSCDITMLRKYCVCHTGMKTQSSSLWSACGFGSNVMCNS